MKRLNKQIPGIRDWRSRSEVIIENVRTFHDEESFIEIQVRRGNSKRHNSSFWKVKTIDYKMSNENQWKCSKSLHFIFYYDAHPPWLLAVSLLGQYKQNFKNKE